MIKTHLFRSFIIVAVAAASVVLFASAHAQALEQGFPDKVGAFARTAVKKTTPAGEASEAAEAKYSAPAGEITWSASSFATPEKAQAALDSMLEKLKADGAKIATNINNAEGKVRFAALETKQGPTYCWVNKKQKTLLYVATGKAPDLSKFMELQNTW
jgi:hypothetical protein